MEQEIELGPWPINLGDGKERFLKFNIGAVKKVRKQYGTIKELLATEAVDVVPGMIFVGLVDESGKPSKEFKTQEELEAALPFALLGKLHLQTMSAWWNFDVEKKQTELAAEAAAKKAAEATDVADPNAQSQTASL